MKEIDIFEELARKDKEIEYHKNRGDTLEKQLFAVIDELKKTQALLRQFLNENTPSSKLPFKNKLPEEKKEQKPRGKPLGSNGATKEEPKNIDRKINAKLGKSCLRCGKIIYRKNIETRIRYVYDAKIIPEIIEVEEEFYPCDCGEFCIGKHPDIPQRGMIGCNL